MKGSVKEVFAKSIKKYKFFKNVKWAGRVHKVIESLFQGSESYAKIFLAGRFKNPKGDGSMLGVRLRHFKSVGILKFDIFSRLGHLRFLLLSTTVKSGEQWKCSAVGKIPKN